jgi:hypothetical protein
MGEAGELAVKVYKWLEIEFRNPERPDPPKRAIKR